MEVNVLLVLSWCLVAVLVHEANCDIPFSNGGVCTHELTPADKDPKRWAKGKPTYEFSDPHDRDQSLAILNHVFKQKKEAFGGDHPKETCYVDAGDAIITHASVKSVGGCAGETTVIHQGPKTLKITFRATAGGGHGFEMQLILKGHWGKQTGKKAYFCCVFV